MLVDWTNASPSQRRVVRAAFLLTQVAMDEAGLPAGLCAAIGWKETRMRDETSSAGAVGPFQLMPAVISRHGVTDPHTIRGSASAAARVIARLAGYTRQRPDSNALNMNQRIGLIQRAYRDGTSVHFVMTCPLTPEWENAGECFVTLSNMIAHST